MNRLLRISGWSLLIVACLVTLVPFAWLVAAAVKTPAALMEHTFLPPVSTWGETLTSANFGKLLFGDAAVPGSIPFWSYLLNSVFLASATTVIQLVLCSLGGYAMAKHAFRGRASLLVFMLGTMVIPGMVFLAPVYALTYHLGWLDTYWALLIPGAVGAFGILLFRQAFAGVPDEIIEAARMDGASELRIWYEVMQPLVRPMSAAFCLITFLGAWNSFIGPQVFLTSQAQLTVPVVLNQYIGQYSQEYGVFLAGTLLAILPPAVLFLALQREFVAGLSSGAVKG